jgi:hypothetical protein
MLVLATFLAIGAFSVAFLVCFLFALHSELQLEKERSARTKQMLGLGIPIAVEVRKPVRGLFVTHSNPGLVRRAEAASSRATLESSESVRTKREA